jgi:nucleotide-binding universal stress UspA family protein
MDAPANTALLLFKTIIFATDFSPGSENAGIYASLLARKFNAELMAAHAFVLSYPAMEVEAEDGRTRKSEQRIDLETALAATAKRLGKGVRNAIPVLLDGDPREQIPRLARESPSSLVVLGTRGRGRMERSIVGSAAERILRAADGPALTVGPEVPPCDPARPLFQRILYATGLSPEAARGATYAAAMAQAFNASLDVLHVVRSEDRADPRRLDEVRKEFQATLEGIVPQQAEAMCKPRGIVEVGSAHERILEHLSGYENDLLVLSLRKSSHLWLQSRLSGAFHIIANAPCPVMTITG